MKKLISSKLAQSLLYVLVYGGMLYLIIAFSFTDHVHVIYANF